MGYRGIDNLKLLKVRALGVLALVPSRLSTLVGEVPFFAIIVAFSFLSRGLSTLLLLGFALERI